MAEHMPFFAVHHPRLAAVASFFKGDSTYMLCVAGAAIPEEAGRRTSWSGGSGGSSRGSLYKREQEGGTPCGMYPGPEQGGHNNDSACRGL